MIQPNELHIGNLVGTFDSDYADEPTIHFVNKVTAISTKGCELDSRSFCAYDELVSIPLTEEWLMKAGFVVVGNYHPEGKTYRNGDFDIMEFYPYLSYKGERIAEVKSVHHLQNVVHALTGQELKIEI